MNTARHLLPGVPWFDINDPASPDLDELAHRFQLHELQIEDTRHRPQRAKVDEYGSYLFAVLKHLHPGEKPLFDDFDVFLGSNFLITVHQGDAPLLAKVCQRVQENHVERLDRILYLLMDLIVDEYLTHLDNSAEAIAKIESQVLKRPEPPVLRDIFKLKRRLIEFCRNAAGMRDVVNAIIRREGGLVGDDLDPYFRDIYDHLIRISDLVDGYRDLISGASDAQLTEEVHFLTAPKTMGAISRIDWVWFLLHDQIHHRGQFSVYLRMAGGKLPSIYGPTADERMPGF